MNVLACLASLGRRRRDICSYPLGRSCNAILFLFGWLNQINMQSNKFYTVAPAEAVEWGHGYCTRSHGPTRSVANCDLCPTRHFLRFVA